MSFRTWLILSLAVLLLHLVLLQSRPLSLSQEPTGPSLTFVTRTISVPQKPAATAPAKPIPRSNRPPQENQAAAPSDRPEHTIENVAQEAPGTAPNEAQTAGSALPTTQAANAPAPSASDAATPPTVQTFETPPQPGTHEPTINADAVPASVKLVYKVDSNKFPYILRSELLWQRTENTYQARLSFSAFAQSRVQTSRGQISNVGLAPERFSDKYRSEVAAHFNHERGLVTFSANTPDAKLQPGAQDRLSVLVQLAALVASAPNRFPPNTTLTIQTIGPRDADLWLFTFAGQELLELPGGSVPGIKLERNPRQLYDQKVELWLAPSLNYLPGRIRITEANGDYFDQKWVSSEAADSP